MPPTEDDFDLQRAEEHFQQRRRYERLPQTAGDLINRLIARRGFTQAEFSQELQRVWQRVAGPHSSPAMQQLGFAKSQLLKQIQHELPHAGIQAIRFRVGSVGR